MAKKDSAFFSRKAEALRSLGIDATPVSEMTIVDIQYNENHVKAQAEAKGLSVDQFMSDIDDIAYGKEDASIPGTPKNTREVIDEQKDPSESGEVAPEVEPDVEQEPQEEKPVEKKEAKQSKSAKK